MKTLYRRSRMGGPTRQPAPAGVDPLLEANFAAHAADRRRAAARCQRRGAFACSRPRGTVQQ